MLYNFFIFLGFIAHLPKILYKTLKQKDRHYPFAERMGFRLPQKIETQKQILWFHANSLGETKAALSFVEYIKRKNNNTYIVFSSVTETGKEIAEKSRLIDLSFYMPLDFSFTMNKLLKRIQPKAIFIIETDFWYQFLKCAKKQGAKIFLVSGKISSKSLKRYRKAFFFSKRLFSFIDHFCLQNSEYEKAFASLGIDAKKLSITGNIKFAQKIKTYQEKELVGFRNILKIKPGDKVITLASTHSPEEIELLDSIDISKYKVLIAPRHPHRFNKVFADLSKKYPIKRLSKPSTIKEDTRIILIDAIGIVPILYQISDLAIVGGSFTDSVGGHNVLEPLMLNTATIFGPYMYGQKDLKETALKTSIVKQVDLKQLPSAIDHLVGKELDKPLSFSEITEKTYETINSKLSS